MAELESSFTEDNAFLAKFIESDRLCRRWRCSRRYLKALENAKVIPPAARVLGVLRYRLEDITRVEKAFTETGRSPMDDEKRREEALARLHLYGHEQHMASALELFLTRELDTKPAFTAADVDAAWVKTAVDEITAVWAIADRPQKQLMDKLISSGKAEARVAPAPELAKLVGGGK
jgi:hypothetical protein